MSTSFELNVNVADVAEVVASGVVRIDVFGGTATVHVNSTGVIAAHNTAAVSREAFYGGTFHHAAYVLLRPGHSAGDALANAIKEEAAKTLPRYKRPQRIHFMTELPRTATGKVQRFKLRQLSAQSSRGS